MTIKFTLSLPEHTTIIEQYDQLLGEHVYYDISWDYPVLPRIGESVDGVILNSYIASALKDQDNLPPRWQVTDIKWVTSDHGYAPLLHLVGKWVNT